MANPPKLYKGAHVKKVGIARDMFVQGVANADGELEFPTIASLARMAGVSKVTLYKIATKEDWKGDRIRVQVAIRAKRDADRAALVVREGARLDEQCIKAAQGLVKEVVRRVNELDANGLDREGEPMRASDASHLSSTLKTAQQAGKLAIGEPTELNGDFENDEAIRGFGRLLDQLAIHRTKNRRTIDHQMDDGGEGGADSAD